MNERKCVGCGIKKDKSKLMKITKSSIDGKIVINPNSYIFGRSAYLCYNENCKELALKKNKLNKALKCTEDLKGILNGKQY